MNTVWVVEWLHPDGTWHVENDFVAPAFFTQSEAKRHVEIISGGMAAGIRRRVVPYIPEAELQAGCHYCLVEQPRYQEKGMTCPLCQTHRGSDPL